MFYKVVYLGGFGIGCGVGVWFGGSCAFSFVQIFGLFIAWIVIVFLVVYFCFGYFGFSVVLCLIDICFVGEVWWFLCICGVLGWWVCGVMEAEGLDSFLWILL